MEGSQVLNQSWPSCKHVLDLNGPRALGLTLSGLLSQTGTSWEPLSLPCQLL